jgi:hypothetical protein
MAEPFAHVQDATPEAQMHMDQVLDVRAAVPQQRPMPTEASYR